MSTEREFRDALAKRDLHVPGELIADGVWHRCDVSKDHGGKGDGSYLLHVNGIASWGLFRNWTDTLGPDHWSAKSKKKLTAEQQREIDQEIARAKAEHKRLSLEMHAEARTKARQMWHAAAEATAYPYCKRKKVEPQGLRIYRFKSGDEVLLVPMRDEAEKLQSVQLIHQDGRKSYLTDSRAGKLHFWICHPKDAEDKTKICICEGWASGESIYQPTGYAVVMAFSAGNLLSIAEWVRREYPDAQIVLCADDDLKTQRKKGVNPGRESAIEAARAVGGVVAMPSFGGKRTDDQTDFNDLHVSQGDKAVKRCIDAAADPDQVDSQIATPVALPIIRVEDGQIARIVDEAQHALIKSGLPIFINSGRMVEPIIVTRDAADGRKTRSTVMASINEAKITYSLNKRAAVFEKFDGRRGTWTPTNPPGQVATTLLSLKDWKFPEVVGIVGAPTMRPDGSILSEYGYDPQTRLWCYADMRLRDIPERPTREQAMVSLRLFKDLLSGYPFVGDIDRSVALAAALTVTLRGAFDLTPMFMIMAHDVANGKSHLVDLLSNITTGRDCPVITAGKSSEELEKRLGSVLLEGGNVVSFDNLSFDLDSDLLCQILTQKIIKIRVLGKSEVPECEWRGTIFATGNNVRVVGDLVRRTLICQLDAKVERPELREFTFDPIARIHSDRETYIAAAITIARAYRAAGRDAPSVRPLAGYAAWSAIVREPLLWLGEHDPVKSMEAARVADPARAAAYELTQRFRQRFGVGDPVTSRDIIATANETKDTAGTPRYPKFRALLLEHVGTTKQDAIDPVKLGRWLQLQNGRVYGTLRIDLIPHKGRANEYVLKEIEDNSSS